MIDSRKDLRSIPGPAPEWISLFQALAFFLILAFLLLPYFRYQLNPDGVSYISIAQKYLSFQVKDAINGYWGPMLSWLMIPLLAMKTDPVVSANILQIIIGSLVLIQSYSLLRKLNFSLWLRTVTLDTIAIIVTFFIYRAICPDLLFLLLCLVFLNIILSGSMLTERSAGVFLGLTGAGLYLTKNFGLPFFAVSLIAYTLLYYINRENISHRSRLLKNFVSGMAIFLVLSGIWILLISVKYGHFTIGTAGEFNRGMIEGIIEHPVYHNGLIKPPDSTAVSVWEDVSYLVIDSPGVFVSFKAVLSVLITAGWNIIAIIKFLAMFSVLALPALLAICIYLVTNYKRALYDILTSLLLILFVLFAGYALIAVDPRYIWLSQIIILAGGVRLLTILPEKFRIPKVVYLISVVILCGSFIIRPVRETAVSINTGKDLFELNEKLAGYSITGKIASDSDWENSMYLSFWSGWHYYGMNGGLADSAIIKELKEYDIDYYITWNPDDIPVIIRETYPEITGGEVSGIRVFQIR